MRASSTVLTQDAHAFHTLTSGCQLDATSFAGIADARQKAATIAAPTLTFLEMARMQSKTPDLDALRPRNLDGEDES